MGGCLKAMACDKVFILHDYGATERDLGIIISLLIGEFMYDASRK